jgi:sugar transferase EpsL
MYRLFLKRLLDVVVSAALLVVCAPILLVSALAVWRKLGRPILLRQLRPGRSGQPFTIYKFRSMTDDRDAAGRLLPDEQRITPLGSFLRAASLDELPELWNVLKGEMSLVGPRPLRMEYLDRYTTEQARRHEARPGVTGLAQVSGRNAIDWDEKFRLDVEYVDSISAGLDARILLLTIATVLKRAGISSDGHATAPEFLGPSSRP